LMSTSGSVLTAVIATNSSKNSLTLCWNESKMGPNEGN
jgi:hypothetical protein